MHKVILSGIDNRISSDIKVESKTSANGKEYKTVMFQIACGNGSYKDAQGNWQQKKADFITVRSAVPNLIERITKIGAKGKCVNLTGTLNVWSIKKQDGTYNNGSCVVLDQDDNFECFDVVKNTNKNQRAPEPINSSNQTDVEVDFSTTQFPFE